MYLETVAGQNELSGFSIVFIWDLCGAVAIVSVAPSVDANMFAAVLGFLIMKSTGFRGNPGIEWDV